MPTADIVVGLGWGDEGKGATTDWLCATRDADRVVRFNGGQQAEHNVIAGGLHHTFSNYGSGTLAGVPTFIGPRCTIDPLNTTRERNALHVKGALTPATRRISVHEDAKVTTPLHVWLNQAKETQRGDARHGSTGTGFGETIAWEYHGFEPLRAGEMNELDNIVFHLDEFRAAHDIVWPDINNFDIAVQMQRHFQRNYTVWTHDDFVAELNTGHTVFEGAQGWMLDEDHGSWPHNTWSTTSAKWAHELCRMAGITDVTVWGVLRTYATRHGAGPLPGEGLYDVPEPHNGTTEWAGAFRTGAWDESLLRWAIDKVRPDVLSLTWCDQSEDIVTTEGPLDPAELGVPVALRSYGPDRTDRTPCA